jgi:hypothetical protein
MVTPILNSSTGGTLIDPKRLGQGLSKKSILNHLIDQLSAGITPPCCLKQFEFLLEQRGDDTNNSLSALPPLLSIASLSREEIHSVALWLPWSLFQRSTESLSRLFASPHAPSQSALCSALQSLPFSSRGFANPSTVRDLTMSSGSRSGRDEACRPCGGRGSCGRRSGGITRSGERQAMSISVFLDDAAERQRERQRVERERVRGRDSCSPGDVESEDGETVWLSCHEVTISAIDCQRERDRQGGRGLLVEGDLLWVAGTDLSEGALDDAFDIRGGEDDLVLSHGGGKHVTELFF